MRYRFEINSVIATALFCCVVSSPCVHAHDTWVQTQTSLVRVADVVHADLMLGNHGNDHRDFKLASKISLEPCTLSVLTPGGKSYDLKSELVDLGYAPKEGYYSARFVPSEPGVHAVVHTLDTLHHTTRAIKSAKTYFLAAESLDNPALGGDELFAKPLGHPLEIVLLSHPGTLGPGAPVNVQVLFEGKPLSNAKLSFIPRGQELQEGFDDEFERMTDENGKASFTPKEGTFLLVSLHHAEPERKGDGFDKTAFGATLVLNVPQVCPCCE